MHIILKRAKSVKHKKWSDVFSLFTSLPCCKKCSADFEAEPVVINKKPGSISNPTFTILDEKNAEEEQQEQQEQDFKDVEARAIANQTNVMT